MGAVRQLNLLCAGAQSYHRQICASQKNQMAYAACQSIYVFQFSTAYSEWHINCILSDHRRSITSIAWHPTKTDFLASSAADMRVCIWSVRRHCVVFSMCTDSVPIQVAWKPGDANALSFVSMGGPLLIWQYPAGLNNHPMPHNKELFMSPVTVFKWNPRCPGKIIFGHGNGSVTICCSDRRVQRHVYLPGMSPDLPDSVTSLEWDPLSDCYVLLAFSSGFLALADTTETLTVVTAYQYPVACSPSTVAWLPNCPGMFVTGDEGSGVLRIWTVSGTNSVENVAVKDIGFRAMCVVDAGSVSGDGLGETLGSAYGSLVCLFEDGGVGVYELARRKWSYLKEVAHIDTIFDCKFKPEDSDILATSSYDGSVRTWSVADLSPLLSLTPPRSDDTKTAVYSISWAPADLGCLAAATSGHGVIVWDVPRQKMIRRLPTHDRGIPCAYSVAWNQSDPRRIASGGSDGYCYVAQVNGVVLHVYKHGSSVYGCDWADRKLLATGCEDGNVRVFDVEDNSPEPANILYGHTAKVFHVKWNPTIKGVICSGSDDCTVRVWDYNNLLCLRVLEGHTGNVRGLAWCPELPHILVSGSWDHTCRVWDCQSGREKAVMRDHGGDIYGLTVHPFRPFLLASCSRDSTVRTWSLVPLLTVLYATIVVKVPHEVPICEDTKHESCGSVKLCGLRGQHLQTVMGRGNLFNTMRNVIDIVSGDANVRNFLDLVCVSRGGKDSASVSLQYGDGIVHQKDLNKHLMSSAIKLETKTNGNTVGSESRLEQVAALYLKSGSIRKYCEVMIQLGRWDHALAVAPGVSNKYWRSLATRRVEMGKDVASYATSIGDRSSLVRFYTERGQLHDAFTAALATMPPAKVEEGISPTEGSGSPADDATLASAASSMAAWFQRRGSPVKAACCHLAVDDIEGAFETLYEGGEIELVALTSELVEGGDEFVTASLKELALRCSKLGHHALAVRVLDKIRDGARRDEEIAMMQIRLDKVTEETCKAIARVASDDPLAKVWRFMCDGTPEVGVALGINEICETIRTNEEWNLDLVWPLLTCIQLPNFEEQELYCHLVRIFFLSAYLGAHMAIRKNYTPVVTAMLKHAKSLLIKDETLTELTGITQNSIQEEQEAWGSKRDGAMMQRIRRRIGKSVRRGGPVMVAGSNLPTHSDVHMCYVTQETIRGPVFILEDGKTALSLGAAIMWARVNPFSPLMNGKKIIPF